MVVRHQGRSTREDSSTGSPAISHPTDRGRKSPPEASASLVVHTPAKLNLVLKVLGRRDDGYHEIETVMVSMGLFDSLVFREDSSDQIHLTCYDGLSRRSGPDRDRAISAGADNLVVRAAELLRQRAGSQRGVAIELIKRIPVQAGLGGGSSDAAATLVTLNQLWKLNLPSALLHELAAELGSDVNFFLDSPLAAVCRGRGERVEPIPLRRRLHAVVISPPSGLLTADVFRELLRLSSSRDQSHGESNSVWFDDLQSIGKWKHGETLRNDLEAPARRLNEDVDAVLTQLRRLSRGPVGMSGSGTACFTLCHTAAQARHLANRLRGVMTGRVFALESRA